MDIETIVVEYQYVGDLSITLWCRFVGEQAVWMVINVYEPLVYNKKEAFWIELAVLMGN